MATISLSASGSTIGTITKTVELNSAQSQAFLEWACAAYPKVSSTNEDGNPIEVDATPDQSVLLAFEGIVKGTLANANRHTEEKLRQQLAEQFQPIEL